MAKILKNPSVKTLKPFNFTTKDSSNLSNKKATTKPLNTDTIFQPGFSGNNSKQSRNSNNSAHNKAIANKLKKRQEKRSQRIRNKKLKATTKQSKVGRSTPKPVKMILKHL